MANDPIATRELETTLGPMLAGATSHGLCLLEFDDRRALPAEREELSRVLEREFVVGSAEHPGSAHLDQIAGELRAYFAGRLTEFATTLHTPGTEFERRVWAALVEIPYGTTTSYGELAERIGSPGAQRAVGRANGRNRIAIVVPCHRVIEANGKLRGYGGGLERKRRLLDHEAAHAGAGSLFVSALR